MRVALTSEEMAYCDRRTIESGTPSIELMRRVAEMTYSSRKWRGRIYIVCGKGNNGGDGLALANIMLDNGITPRVFLIDGASTADSKYYLNILENRGFAVSDISDCDFNCDITVDCIFGTGFKGAPRGKFADAIDRINASNAYKISVDIPSGLDASSGKFDLCVRADETVTVQYPKVGLYLGGGKDVTGKLSVIDVGIGLYAQGAKIVGQEDTVGFFPRRKHDTHKGSYGKSAIFGGCSNYLGAVKLANAGLCALRSGGGLNMLIVPKSHADNIAKQVFESTLFPMADNDGYMRFDREKIDCALVGVDTLAIGMGIGGNHAEIRKILSYILSNYAIKIIIDADGLNALAMDVDILKNSKADVILTPHVKEMSRLCSRGLEEILQDPIGVAKSFASEYGCVVLLKGSSTVVTDGDEVYLVVNGGAELAKGGSGDTLSGVMLGLLSQGHGALQSAYAAAYITAKVAKDLVEEYSEYGVLPSDVSREIAKIVKNSEINKKEN